MNTGRVFNSLLDCSEYTIWSVRYHIRSCGYSRVVFSFNSINLYSPKISRKLSPNLSYCILLKKIALDSRESVLIRIRRTPFQKSNSKDISEERNEKRTKYKLITRKTLFRTIKIVNFIIVPLFPIHHTAIIVFCLIRYCSNYSNTVG